MADATGSGDLTAFYEARNIKPGDLITTFNPQRIKPHGFGNTAIGGDPAATGPFYIFVTRPDLNIFSQEATNALSIGTPVAPREIAELLCFDKGTGFIKLLTNLAEGFGVQDVVLDTYSIGEGWDGSKMNTPRSTLNSRQDGSLQIEFQEWSGLPVTTLHRLWVEYIEAVTKGILVPKTGTPDYMLDRVLDFACSIYYFQTLPDAQTIEFGVRFTGCFPTAVPFSPWNARLGNAEGVKVSVPYTYAYMEPMEPWIFKEFNSSAGSSGVSVGETTLPDSKRKVYSLNFSEGKTLENFL